MTEQEKQLDNDAKAVYNCIVDGFISYKGFKAWLDDVSERRYDDGYMDGADRL